MPFLLLARPRTVRPFSIVLALSAIVNVVPLFCARHLPITDLPEHIAAIATLRHYWDPAWRSQEYFVLQSPLETQYWLYHGVGALLTLVTGSAERANLVLMALIGLAHPYALRALLRVLGRDERLAIFGCALFWTQSFTVGLLNFVASVPLVLFGLALVVRQGQTPTRRRALALAVLATAIFYLHISSFLLFATESTLFVLGLACEPLRFRLISFPRRLAWLAPSIAFAAGVFFFGHTDRHAVEYGPRLALLARLPAWLFDSFRTRTDDLLGTALALVLLALALFGDRGPTKEERRRDRVVAASFVCSLGFLFLLPSSVGPACFLDIRMATFVALFAVLLPRPAKGVRGTGPLALAAALALAIGTSRAAEVRAFENEEVDHFDALLDDLPAGKRLVSLSYEPSSSERVFSSPFLYFGAYYRARHGGLTLSSFTTTPHWPIQHRAAFRPPPGVTWDGDPKSFDNARDGSFFDYVLVRGTNDAAIAATLSHGGPRWTLVGATRAWRLYGRE